MASAKGSVGVAIPRFDSAASKKGGHRKCKVFGSWEVAAVVGAAEMWVPSESGSKRGGKVGPVDFSTVRHLHGALQTRGEKVEGSPTKQVRR